MNRNRIKPTATARRRPALRRRQIGAAALVATVMYVPIALSCGYEDPNSASIQRGALNLSYRNALYVVGALTQARMDGVIAPPSEGLPAKDLFGSQFHKTAMMLQKFGDALVLSPNDDLVFSLVLVEPMLWTRFAVREGRVTTSVHLNGPAADAPVVIATEAVLGEIAEHRMTPERAAELDLIRFYGDPEKVVQLRAVLANRATQWSGKVIK